MKLYPPQSWLFRVQKNKKIWRGKTAVSVRFLLKKIRAKRRKNRTFFGESFATPFENLANNKRSYPNIVRPRPIDCDRVSEQPVKNNPGLRPFFCSIIAPKKIFYRVPDLVTICTPKEAHSRNFVTGPGHFSRDKSWRKKSFLGKAQACVPGKPKTKTTIQVA